MTALRSARKSDGALRIRVDPEVIAWADRAVRRTTTKLPAVRVVFAGTPEVALPALEPDRLPARGRRRRTRPDAPGRRGGGWSPARSRSGRRRRASRCSSRQARDPDFLDRLPEIAPGLLPGGRLRGAAAGGRARHPAARLGQPALLAAARLAGRRPRAAGHHGGRRGHGGLDLPDREGAGRRPAYGTSPSRSGPTDTTGDLLHRLASAAPGCWSPPWTASRTAAEGGAAAGCRHRSPRRSTSRTPRSTGPRRRAGRPADPGVRARPGRLDDLPRRAAQDHLAPDRGDLAPGALAVEEGGPRRYRHPAPGARSVQPQGKKPMKAADWARGVSSDERAGAGYLRESARQARRSTPARRGAFDALRSGQRRGRLREPGPVRAARGWCSGGCRLRHRAVAGTCAAQGTYDVDLAAPPVVCSRHAAARRARPAPAGHASAAQPCGSRSRRGRRLGGAGRGRRGERVTGWSTRCCAGSAASRLDGWLDRLARRVRPTWWAAVRTRTRGGSSTRYSDLLAAAVPRRAEPPTTSAPGHAGRASRAGCAA